MEFVEDQPQAVVTFKFFQMLRAHSMSSRGDPGFISAFDDPSSVLKTLRSPMHQFRGIALPGTPA